MIQGCTLLIKVSHVGKGVEQIAGLMDGVARFISKDGKKWCGPLSKKIFFIYYKTNECLRGTELLKICWKRHVITLTLGTAECNLICWWDLYRGNQSKLWGHSYSGPLASMTRCPYKRRECGHRDRKAHRENVKEYSCMGSMVSESQCTRGCGQRILLQMWDEAKLFPYLDSGLLLCNSETVCFCCCQPASLWSSPRMLTQFPVTIFPPQTCLTCDPWHTCDSGQLWKPPNTKSQTYSKHDVIFFFPF